MHDPAELARVRAAQAFVVDMDGTIYVDDRLVPGAERFLAHLDRHGIPYLLLTNNSAARAADYHARLARLGIQVPVERVMTSGDATIAYLLGRTSHRSACLVGTPALEADFRAAGIALDAADPDCVVVGFDTTLTYAKLERACALLFRGKPWFATHPDKTCITARGLVPDIAAIIAACETVTGRKPLVIGKPCAPMIEAAAARLGVAPGATVIVGDQLDTDMTMARASGACGVLVMSGETSAARLAAWPAAERPRLVMRDLGELTDCLAG